MTWPNAASQESRVALRSSPQPVEILLVEDSRGDAELMIEALEESAMTVRITHVEDGEEAVGFLRRQGSHQNARRPDLILLDLHMPRKNGHEVLSDIKQDESLRLIPVVLMTGDDTEEAIAGAYERHANCCVRKPSNLDQFAQAVKKIETFWLRTARRHHEP
jgi:two-component system, chemotaxis family, response regulator Rcp1